MNQHTHWILMDHENEKHSLNFRTEAKTLSAVPTQADFSAHSILFAGEIVWCDSGAPRI